VPARKRWISWRTYWVEAVEGIGLDRLLALEPTEHRLEAGHPALDAGLLKPPLVEQVLEIAPQAGAVARAELGPGTRVTHEFPEIDGVSAQRMVRKVARDSAMDQELVRRFAQDKGGLRGNLGHAVGPSRCVIVVDHRPGKIN
jgi:hypothetical protein